MLSPSYGLNNYYLANKRHSRLLVLGALVISSLFLAMLVFALDGVASAAPVAFDCTTVSQIPQSECNALVTLYNNTTGTNWKNNTNWLVTNTPCSWYGVSCSAGRVTVLQLQVNQLVGTIPPDLGNITNLTNLSLYGNQLNGSIPPELGQLTGLIHLLLNNNQLTGLIPTTLGNLSKLQTLYLHTNQLTGRISSELGNLPDLREIVLYGNQLNGAIPNTLGNLTKLQYLHLAVNQLSGEIPSQLGNAISLTNLSLYGNQLSGSIPLALGQLSQLTILELNNNQLTGPIPDTLGNLSKLQSLHLHTNQLSGSIPSSLGNLADLREIVLYGNQLNGEIPSSIGNLTKLQYLHLGANQLNGVIPPQLGNAISLTNLSLWGNQLSGSIPSTFGQLSQLNWLDLSNNQLTDVIPSGLGKLTNLQILRLQNNKLTGSIPKELGGLINLNQLYLGINSLTGSIPPELGKLVNLSILYLPSAQLTGFIPPELGNLLNLSRLELQSNNLDGPIPASLGKLSGLIQLILEHNQLSGSMPTELGHLEKLSVMMLANNHLSGPIPSELANLKNLTILQLQNNQLSGGIPASLGDLEHVRNFYLDSNALSGEIPGNFVNLGKTWLITPTNTLILFLDKNMLGTSNPGVQEFLKRYNPSALNTQTLPPTNLQVTGIRETSIDLSWNPPVYNFDPGGYDVQITRQGSPPEVREIVNDKKVFTGTVSNLCPGTTYSFALRTHTAPHSTQQNDLRSEFTAPVSAPTLPRTSGLLALYLLAFDSNLDKQYDAVLQAIQSATQADFGKVAVVLVDRKGENNTQILHVECGVVEPIQGLPNPTTSQLDPNLHEYNMADPAALGAFIKWARATYNFSVNVAAGTTSTTTQSYPPTMLSYVGHGVAIAPDTDISQYVRDPITTTVDISTIASANLSEGSGFQPPTQTKINMTPDQVTDATSKSLISPYALAQALSTGTYSGTQPLTLLDIIHCFGGTVEEFYELANPGGSPYAQAITGSPNYAYAGAEMLKAALLAIQPTQSAREMAAKVVQAYDTALNLADQSDNNPDVNHPRIIVAVESSKIPTITRQIDQLATGLLQEFDRAPVTTTNKIKIAQAESIQFDTTTCKLEGRPQDFKLNSEDGLADLADFVTQVKLQFSSVPAITDAATQIALEVNGAVITTTRKSGYPWFATTDPKPFWEFPDRAIGIGIFADFNGITLEGKPYVTWQAYWYNRDNLAGKNPHPYAFVTGSNKNWSDLFVRFWEERLGPNGEIGTYACSTTLPEIRFVEHRLYLPVVVR